MPAAAPDTGPLDKHVPVVVSDESGEQQVMICRYINRRGMIIAGCVEIPGPDRRFGIGDVLTVEFRGQGDYSGKYADRIGVGDGYQVIAEVVAITTAGIGLRFVEGGR